MYTYWRSHPTKLLNVSSFIDYCSRSREILRVDLENLLEEMTDVGTHGLKVVYIMLCNMVQLTPLQLYYRKAYSSNY